jgi:simple sugar transport system permease protein
VGGGAIAALGGAHLSLDQHEFVAYMSGGRGFLALAAVILGGWNPLRACVAAVCIGGLAALEATLAGRVPFPPAVLQALPFAATLVAVVGIVGRTRAPRALG